jgi:hypothetical protein
MISVNYHAPWHQLTHTIVGRSYSQSFYEPIKNSKIRDCLQKIAQETEEDYQQIVQVLTQAGVTVDRPNLDTTKTILDFADDQGHLDYTNTHSFTLIPRPPMQPRDSLLIVGNQLLKTNNESQYYQNIVGNVGTDAALTFDAPMATVVGDTIVVDCRDNPGLADYFIEHYPEHHIKPVYIGGHNDAVFSLLKPGVILSTYHQTNYNQTFPDWKVKFIENQSWNAIPDWRKLKHSNNGKWWSPEQESNPEFAEFVNQWLNNWLGYVEETVFDVNLLSINDRTILVNNYNQDLFEFFKQQNIEPVVVPFRHRFFWDGGIHCVTSDLYRQGIKENYVR